MRSSSAALDPKAESLLSQVVERARRSRLPSAARRRQIREKAGVSVREMAELAGVSPMAISRWERGDTPSPENAVRYRAVLDALREAG